MTDSDETRCDKNQQWTPMPMPPTSPEIEQQVKELCKGVKITPEAIASACQSRAQVSRDGLISDALAYAGKSEDHAYVPAELLRMMAAALSETPAPAPTCFICPNGPHDAGDHDPAQHDPGVLTPRFQMVNSTNAPTESQLYLAIEKVIVDDYNVLSVGLADAVSDAVTALLGVTPEADTTVRTKKPGKAGEVTGG